VTQKAMSPVERYQLDLSTANFNDDKTQAAAVNVLQQSFTQLTEQNNSRTIQSLFSSKKQSPQNIYLWGKVGRGKTYLMDCFYNSLPFSKKYRTHFYRFMQYVHQQLAHHQGNKDPLKLVAKSIAKKAQVLCLDEFFVTDIADAMILGGLLKYLFEERVTLITTSNVEPCLLYKEGLQRDRFLPSIELIYSNMTIHHLDGKQDHRLRELTQTKHFYAQDDVGEMQQQFFRKNGNNIKSNTTLQIEGRNIDCRFVGDGCCWFEFDALCRGARSQNDYIALANEYHSVYISAVPQMGGVNVERDVARGTEDTYNINQRVADRPFNLAPGDDEARRFICLVDEFYDRSVKLVLSAHVPMMSLYVGGRVEFEFERTYSRLVEMQSEEYLT